jgi:2'-phosphotransferase
MSTKIQDRVKISKQFSKILRHTAHEYASLLMDEKGFIPLDSLLALPEFSKQGVDEEFVNHMVEDDSKSRFSLENRNGVLCIRANQGHSDSVAESLSPEHIYQPIMDASQIPVVIHGTSPEAWNAIKVSGLKRMLRSHIHFSPGVVGVDAEVRSGMRRSSTIHIYMDVAKCFNKGIRFYRSANNVILSEGIDGTIPPDCFLKVVDFKTGTVLYP